MVMESATVVSCPVCSVRVPMGVKFTLAEAWEDEDVYEIGGLRFKGEAEPIDLFAHLCTHEDAD